MKTFKRSSQGRTSPTWSPAYSGILVGDLSSETKQREQRQIQVHSAYHVLPMSIPSEMASHVHSVTHYKDAVLELEKLTTDDQQMAGGYKITYSCCTGHVLS